MMKIRMVAAGLVSLAIVLVFVMQSENGADSLDKESRPAEVADTTRADDDFLTEHQQLVTQQADKSKRVRRFSGKMRSKELDRLITGDADAKRQAFDDLIREVQGAAGIYKKYGNDLYPYLAYALSDPDQETAQYAASVLYVLALSSVSGVSSTGFPPIGGEEYIKPDLKEAFQNSNNPSVRRHAAEILAYAFGDNADVQSWLADGFDPASPRRVRAGVVNGLRFIYLRSKLEPDSSATVLSEESLDVISTAVADPGAGISLSALDAVQYVKPDGALPNLIHRLPTATYPGHANKILEVIQLYDESRLLPYIESLKEASSVAESDELKGQITDLVQKLTHVQ